MCINVPTITGTRCTYLLLTAIIWKNKDTVKPTIPEVVGDHVERVDTGG